MISFNFKIKPFIMNSKMVKSLCTIIRKLSTKPTSNAHIELMVYNRNPRNLERLRLDWKPTGYAMERKNIEFWHKLEIKKCPRHIEALIVHNSNKVVVSASTNEWAIRKHLYSADDKQAHIILGKVFSERCMESGLTTFACYPNEGGESPNIQAFIDVLREEGLSIKEPDYFNVHNIWFDKIEEKPWTVIED